MEKIEIIHDAKSKLDVELQKGSTQKYSKNESLFDGNNDENSELEKLEDINKDNEMLKG